MAVVIETTLGDITVDLFIEERPRACLNFIKLCKLKYYNLNLFHTIERDFIAQTGDPVGAGDGGESVWGVVEGPHKRFFEAESLPKIKHTAPGLLSLVSVGKFMVGSQFFFTLGADLTSLDGIHCVIGEVVEGREVLRQLNEAIVDEKFRPYQDIRVTHTVILDDPFSDPRGFQVPSRSPSPSAERMQNGRIGADEDIDDTEGKTMEEIQEMLAEREAKARATILEIVGDLPDADIAPPENVLFVCKLNPVTTDDDLEIIFSRFGKVKSCEVIRDKVSGDSLQYAFVEFEEQKSCEAAYFKMDNVLIDDRRIHVDFSQSVSKIQWRGKGRGVVHADDREKKLDFNNLKDDKGRGRRQRGYSRSPNRRTENGGRSYDRRRSRDRDSRSNKHPPDSRGKPTADESARRSVDRGGGRRREGKDRSLSPIRRPANSHRSDERKRSRDRDSRQNRRQSPVEKRRRSPPNERRRSPERSQHERRRSPPNDSRYTERTRGRDVRPHENRTSTFNKQRYDRDSSFSTSRGPHRDVSPDPQSKKSSSSVKSPKKKAKSKKKKKPVSSSSSSESDSDSSSTSTSSSSSEEEKRKKAKKSKKKDQKSKKRPKKKSKKRASSSTD